ncbi:transporter substrate-binding domain-containing protein [Marinobacter sp. chi1]|uniref:Transporter substrate-binding domain-containing protein n=1 Tax=Marinobacter suaedae TaxID=3057675 RepID=A0ABT8VZC9_9GAMM|nr:transporter substrate-binding domain-containing protein [Marinobacter sp. chi1]MDO3721353.1 transporter substrate-binding domain-containing protein [Marinobacter sp. chi1]
MLRIAYVEFPPLTYRSPQGEPAGIFINITRRLVEQAGYVPEFVYLPTSRAYLYLKNGEIDVWPGMTNIPSLKGQILESWASPFSFFLCAWSLSNNEPLTHFDELKGKTVIVISGYTYNGLLGWLKAAEGIRVTEAPNHRAAVEMLKLKRGDYLLDYRSPVRDILSEEEKQLFTEVHVRRRSGAWLFSLANPRAAILREVFDDAYMQLFEQGVVPPVQDKSPGPVMPGFPEQFL